MIRIYQTSDHVLTLTQQIEAACLMEVTARKPGNVHPGADFDETTYNDFVASARVVAPILSRAGDVGVGRVIREAVEATQREVGQNTNLGIILLFAPLAAAPSAEDSSPRFLRAGIVNVLESLTTDDARECYAAIRLANPGGLGEVDQADVSAEPTRGLVDAMRLAANRDRVAAQYANGFREVLDLGLTLLQEIYEHSDWETSVTRLHLEFLSRLDDTLIARKCGAETAEESGRRARKVLEKGGPLSSAGRTEMEHFDHWLRADGHRRNPGTTADLVAATLFAGLRAGVIEAP